MLLLDLFKKKQKKEKTLADLGGIHKNMLRLVYVGIGKFKKSDTGEWATGNTYISSSAFKLPKYMTMEQACKVVSFLSEKVEQEYFIAPASQESVGKVSHILCDYGFEKSDLVEPDYTHTTTVIVDKKNHAPQFRKPKYEYVVDLLTICSREPYFKNSDLSDRYFNWFTENVSVEEVEEIYRSIDLDFNKLNDASEIKQLKQEQRYEK